MNRKGSAVWKGGLKDGRGTVSTDSGALRDVVYTFGTRFAGEPGTNPEELVAAAHAGCFSMALSLELGKAGLTPESVRTTSTVTLEKVEDGFAVTKVHLDVLARVPNAGHAAFDAAAGAARAGCPISRLLSAPITMTAKLEA
ncbi:MAG: OsmC family protein [Chthonomonadales bacterium]|nr:OsmC family protein [Chthonomonadales bacterium]